MARNVDQEKHSEQDLRVKKPDVQHSNASQASLSTIIAWLPEQYFRSITRPSTSTFVETKEYASWKLIWLQLLSWAILDALLAILVNRITPPATGTPLLAFFSLATSIGLVVLIPAIFFLLMVIVYLFAKALGGQGTFLDQCNASLSIQVPLGILSKLLALIPGVGRILNSVLSLYGIVLQVGIIMAVHRLSAIKATITLLLSGGMVLIAIGSYMLVNLLIAH